MNLNNTMANIGVLRMGQKGDFILDLPYRSTLLIRSNATYIVASRLKMCKYTCMCTYMDSTLAKIKQMYTHVQNNCVHILHIMLP